MVEFDALQAKDVQIPGFPAPEADVNARASVNGESIEESSQGRERDERVTNSGDCELRCERISWM